MTELFDRATTDPWIVIIEVAIIFIVINWVWANGIKPTWEATRRVVYQRDRQARLNTFADHWEHEDDVQADAERWQVLQEIADQFKPNGGESLYDQIQALHASVYEVKNLVEVYIVDRRPGGRRSTDPAGSDEEG